MKVYLYSGVAFPGAAAARKRTVTDCIYPRVNSLLNIKENGGILSRIHFSCNANLSKQGFQENGSKRLTSAGSQTEIRTFPRFLVKDSVLGP